MIYFSITLIGMLLILIQSTIIPLFPILKGFYDINLPLVVFIASQLNAKVAIIIILILGYAMDILSGSAFGLYCITYIWLMIGISLITIYFHAKSTLILVFIIAMGTFIENSLFIISSIQHFNICSGDISIVFYLYISQIIYVLLSAPFLLSSFIKMINSLDSKF